MANWQSRVAFVLLLLVGQVAHSGAPAASKEVVFGPLADVEVPDDTTLEAAWLLDLDAGMLLTPPKELLQSGDLTAFKEWLAAHGIDAMGEGYDDGLVGFNIMARRIDGPIAERFPDVDANQVARLIKQMVAIGDPGSPVGMDAGRGVGSRATYLFKTREGGEGVLQITGWDSKGAVGVRFRLLSSQAERKPVATPIPIAETTDDVALQVFRKVQLVTLHGLSTSTTNLSMLDLDGGATYPHLSPELSEDRGVDVYPKPFPVHHTLKGRALSVVRVPAGAWFQPREAERGLELLSSTDARDYVDMPANSPGEPPATYLFKTSEGSLGILRLLKPDNESHSLDIEYRLKCQ